MIADFADAVAALRDAGIDSPRLEARLLRDHAQDDPAAFDALLARRVAHEPLAYILGRKEFWSLDFAVGPGVLIPRPDSETLVEAVLAAYPDGQALNVLDLGTGSGCLLGAILSAFPAATGLGVELSEAAASFAARNLARFGPRCRVERRDWAGLAGRFDVVVSNPPYIRSGDIADLVPDIVRFEPHTALDGGADGLDAYRVLAPLAAALLNSGGRVFFEIGQGQDGDVKHLLQAAGLSDLSAAADPAGILRVVSGRKP